MEEATIARTIRAFTIDFSVQLRLEEMLANGERNGLTKLINTAPDDMMKPSMPKVEVDSFGLRPQDYDAVYQVAGVPPAKRVADAATFKRLVSQYMPSDHNSVSELSKALTQVRREARRAVNAAKRAEARAVVTRNNILSNRSRAVEALLVLGMDTLEKRAAENTGGKQEAKSARREDGHAGQTQNKSSKSRARKAIAA